MRTEKKTRGIGITQLPENDKIKYALEKLKKIRKRKSLKRKDIEKA